MLAMPVGAAPDTGPELGVFNRIMRPVVGFNTGDQTIFHMHPEQAPAPAIVGGAAYSYEFISMRIYVSFDILCFMVGVSLLPSEVW